MSNQAEQGLGILTIERRFEAPVATVFAAFTDPVIMSAWFSGYPGGVAKMESDLRVGGKYCIDMYPAPTDNPSTTTCADNPRHYGEYLEIEPPHRLAFTWIKDGFVAYSEVAIDFAPSGAGTLVTLTHRVPPRLIGPHREGWTHCLDNLTRRFAAR